MTPPAITDVLNDAHGGAVPNTGTVRRAREQAVPCQRCGAQRTPTGVRPRTLTGNLSALCDRHETTATAPPHLHAGDTAVALFGTTTQHRPPPSASTRAHPPKTAPRALPRP